MRWESRLRAAARLRATKACWVCFCGLVVDWLKSERPSGMFGTGRSEEGGLLAGSTSGLSLMRAAARLLQDSASFSSIWIARPKASSAPSQSSS